MFRLKIMTRNYSGGFNKSRERIAIIFNKGEKKVNMSNIFYKRDIKRAFQNIKEVVGDARFELATPWTQTKCATKLR